ncbi:MAG: hypothetical protein ABW080_11085 [Candidatus Thiodiazotropha sp.]
MLENEMVFMRIGGIGGAPAKLQLAHSRADRLRLNLPQLLELQQCFTEH